MAALGVALTPDGYIEVDTEQQTNVAGVYAAGDITRHHAHQVAAAVHEGGQAASAANYCLYPSELRDDWRQVGPLWRERRISSMG